MNDKIKEKEAVFQQQMRFIARESLLQQNKIKKRDVIKLLSIALIIMYITISTVVTIILETLKLYNVDE